MAKEEIEPTISQGRVFDNETVMEHPAFGQITVSRISGSRNLYGSDFDHHNFVRITIYKSELHRTLSRDWPYQREEVVSVDMSEAQWATFVSSFGSGSGVQCTLNRLMGESVPTFPHRDEGQEYKIEANKAVQEAVDNLVELRGVIEANVQGLSKVKQNELLKNVNKSLRKLTDSLPFITSSFSEHMEERVEKAKVEVHAYLNESIKRAGLEAITEGVRSPLLLQQREQD